MHMHLYIFIYVVASIIYVGMFLLTIFTNSIDYNLYIDYSCTTIVVANYICRVSITPHHVAYTLDALTQ